jgi:hypothetical protein
MFKIENPKYKSAFLTILFYVILCFLITIRYAIFPSGIALMVLETIAPIILPLLSVIFLVINIWKYYYRAKINIISIIIHSTVILFYLILIIIFLG